MQEDYIELCDFSLQSSLLTYGLGSHFSPSRSLSLFVSFFLSAGHGGRVSTLRRLARPTTHCYYGVVGISLSLSLSSSAGRRRLVRPPATWPPHVLWGFRQGVKTESSPPDSLQTDIYIYIYILSLSLSPPDRCWSRLWGVRNENNSSLRLKP